MFRSIESSICISTTHYLRIWPRISTYSSYRGMAQSRKPPTIWSRYTRRSLRISFRSLETTSRNMRRSISTGTFSIRVWYRLITPSYRIDLIMSDHRLRRERELFRYNYQSRLSRDDPSYTSRLIPFNDLPTVRTNNSITIAGSYCSYDSYISIWITWC